MPYGYRGLKIFTSLSLRFQDFQRQKLLDNKRKLEIQIMELSGNTTGALTEKRKDELAAMDASLRFSQQAIWALTDANNKVSGAISGVSRAISLMTTLANKLRSTLATTDTSAQTLDDRQNARAIVESALAIAKAGGSISNISGLDQALTDIAKPSENLYATFVDYARAQGQTGGTISQLADYADAQVSMAQQQLDAINATTSAVLSLGEALSALSGAISNKNAIASGITAAQAEATKAAQAKSDSIAANANLADALAVSATDTAAALASKKLAEELSIIDPASKRLGDTKVKGVAVDGLKSQYADIKATALSMGLTVDAKTGTTVKALTTQYNALSTAVANAAVSSASSLAGIAAASAAVIPELQSAADKANAAYSTALTTQITAENAVPNINGFAAGGVHSGGWRVVGERGAELENTGASRIYSHGQSKSLLDTSELVAEVKALREEIRAGQAVIANNTKATTKILRDVTQNGTSISTVAA